MNIGISNFLIFIIVLFSVMIPKNTFANITNNQNAADLIGQYDDAEATIVNYTKSTLNNGAGSVNNLGLKEPVGLLLDQTNHRLFVGDRGNHRVLVYNLNTNNDLIDRIPDYVLGQPDFTTNTAATTQAGMSAPNEFAYDSVNNYLFVAEGNNNRVTVYDVSTITNGEDAIYVLGQPDFTTSTAATTQAGMSGAFGMAYDSDNQKLFVSQYGSRRVTVYDVSTITNGEDAIYVLGQPDFTTSTAATSQAGVGTLRGLSYDSVNNRLFLADTLYHRITVYDVSTITNGEDAIYVLGQPDFTTNTATYTQSGLNGTKAVAYDSVNNRLFAADSWSHRVTVYDVSTITNGEDAIYVLGQPDFTSHSGSTTQAGMRDPVGLAFNQTAQKLFVSNFNNNNVTIYDFSNPIITSVSTSNITNTSVTITWTTNEESSTLVEYSLDSSYSTSTAETDTSTRVTSHTVSLSNLNPCTSYQYRVKSNDSSSNLATDTNHTLEMPGCQNSSTSAGSRAYNLFAMGKIQDAKDIVTQFPNALNEIKDEDVKNELTLPPQLPNSNIIPTFTKLIRKGVVNPVSIVKIIQKVIGVEADGKFGPITLKAVKEFQTKNDLKSDGIVGPITWKLINSY